MFDGQSISPTVYNAMTIVLAAATLVVLGVALYSLILMLVRWKTPERRRHAIRLILAIIAVPCLAAIQYSVLFFVFLPSLGRQLRAERLARWSAAHVDDPAPQFSLTTVDGHRFSVPEGGKVTLIVFFATWCGPCQLELPHIERIWQANKNNERFRLLVIGREETTDSVREYRDKKGFTFPIAADPDGSVYSLFAKDLIPRTIIVSPERRMVYSNAGFSEDDLNELNLVLQEQLGRLR